MSDKENKQKRGKNAEDIDRSIKKMKEFESPEVLYNELINSVRKYHPSTDLTLIEKAYQVAYESHKTQKRKSGEPYIIHPLCVAIILADLELDKETIAAGLLHDVVEDTVMTEEEIAKEFGEEVAILVDGVTKLGKLSYDADKDEIQAENLRKMFLAMAKDIRVILIKLADRLHNMRTLQHMKPEKQREKAQETMDIYCPIASRLGISKIKVELDDLALKYLETDAYYQLVNMIQIRKSVRESFIQELVTKVKGYMVEAGIEARVDGRIKHFFSIYKKMKNQNKTIDEIYDLFAVRIIVETVPECYAALGIIHEKFKPIPGRFKDYIAMPKENMYRSLHTTLIGPLGQPFEIQIRTYEMHRTAEYGIAAHWKYKEASDGKKSDLSEEAKLSWLREILEWQRDMADNKEFLKLVKSDLDLFSESVYCFTPSGDVINLPNGSTPIDFAYMIHSAVGNKMIGARVNNKLVNINYEIKNGDRIEILTSNNSRGPSRDWLGIVKSTQAKNKINQWFKKELKEENIIRGKEELLKYCKSKGIPSSDISKTAYMDVVMNKYGFKDWDSVLAAIGHGSLKESQVVNRMYEAWQKDHKSPVSDDDILEEIGENLSSGTANQPKAKNRILVGGASDVSVRLSKCCTPLPGDEIVGYVTRGHGVAIHRTDCPNIMHLSDMERERIREAEWIPDGMEFSAERYLAEIKIYGNNRKGLLVDISKVFTENDIDIKSIHSATSKKEIATISVSFEIKELKELNQLIEKIRMINSVFDIERSAS